MIKQMDINLKHVFFPILICLIFQSNAFTQFKQVNGSHNTQINTNQSELHPLWKFKKSGEEARDFTKVRFQPKELSSKNLIQLPQGFIVEHYDENNNPIAISGKLEEKARRGKDLEDQSKTYIDKIGKIIGIDNPWEELKLLETNNDDQGQTHLKFNQTYRGVEILGAELITHAERSVINYVNGNWHKSPNNINTIPSISKEVSIAKLGLKDEQDPNNLDNFGLYSQMKPVSKLVLLPQNDTYLLIYHITAYPDFLHKWEYHVDAHTGETIHKYMNSCKLHNHKLDNSEFKKDLTNHQEECIKSGTETALAPNMKPMADGHVVMQGRDLFGITRTINSYEKTGIRYMIDANRDMFRATASLPNNPTGAIWTIDAGNRKPVNQRYSYNHISTSAASWDNPSAISAHYNGSKSYDYFKNTFGRNSIDGRGGTVISFINVADDDGASMGNAFWNGQGLYYGNGDSGFFPLARALDVAGHEMAHGVIQNTANLNYENESGALNESFADVFGSLIDRDDWKIGEDVVRTSVFPSGALRDLEDPNNKAPRDNYNKGYQPKVYSNRYRGTENNGGVHINSGIPNYAYFLFASNPQVGKDRAERVYFRALSTYLTRSSRFVDCRAAIIKSSQDLYGDVVAKVAENAWNTVEVFGSTNNPPLTDTSKTKYEVDLKENPGEDLIFLLNGNGVGMDIINLKGEYVIPSPLSSRKPLSKPSITDSGREIVYVGQDKKIYYISINYELRTKQEVILVDQAAFRNVVISKDGQRIAVLTDELQPTILVFDFSKPLPRTFTLRNPTTAEGISTGEVVFADAMEWDHSGEYVMYDALNKVEGQGSASISYWDINFLRAWSLTNKDYMPNETTTFSKLIQNLPLGVDIGNPTFSKNSPYIIAFDYQDDEGTNSVLGANIENGNIGLIAESSDLGYPTYSKNDKFVLFDAASLFNPTNIKIVTIDASKIKSAKPKGDVYIQDAKWATWFGNGFRVTTDVKSEKLVTTIGYPNPASEWISLSFEATKSQSTIFELYSVEGKLLKSIVSIISNGSNITTIDIKEVPAGTFMVKARIDGKSLTHKFIKI